MSLRPRTAEGDAGRRVLPMDYQRWSAAWQQEWARVGLALRAIGPVHAAVLHVDSGTYGNGLLTTAQQLEDVETAFLVDPIAHPAGRGYVTGHVHVAIEMGNKEPELFLRKLLAPESWAVHITLWTAPVELEFAAAMARRLLYDGPTTDPQLWAVWSARRNGEWFELRGSDVALNALRGLLEK